MQDLSKSFKSFYTGVPSFFYKLKMKLILMDVRRKKTIITEMLDKHLNFGCGVSRNFSAMKILSSEFS